MVFWVPSCRLGESPSQKQLPQRTVVGIRTKAGTFALRGVDPRYVLVLAGSRADMSLYLQSCRLQ